MTWNCSIETGFTGASFKSAQLNITFNGFKRDLSVYLCLIFC
jgi:hypothetical protein